VQYDVIPGERHKVISVNVTGNHYFDTDTLEDRLRVKKASLYVRNGTYSTQLMNADAQSIQSLYRASGFLEAKVTSAAKETQVTKKGKTLAEIGVLYTVHEGPQQKFGTVAVTGADPTREQTLRDLMTAETGQPFSLITLSDDRDALLSYLIAQGFDHAQVEVNQKVEDTDKERTDVTLNVVEGRQVKIDHVLLSGLNHTRRSLVESQVEVHAGDPLDQAALLQTQRNLYNLALFNEVNTAVQNPTGDAPEKNVLIQVTEAKRWDVTYGAGFEAQLEEPGVIPGQTRGSSAAQNGRAGASPRVSLDVSRINLRGTQQSLTLHTTYGLLEELAELSYNVPQLFSNPNLTGTISGGYSNVQNITTFEAQTLQGDFRVSQKVKRADTFIYDFQYRRITVDSNTLEISPNLIPQLSEPVRVGGPALTYFHDTRDPSPLNATRGQYFTLQEFFADSIFGSDTDFNRLDMSHSSYYTWGKRQKYTFARNLRVGFENTFGTSSSGTSGALGIENCAGVLATTNATCNPIPLPERMYAGGATSHRGFGINDAGPRDLTTGYPVGGSGVVVNQFELRLPPATLPYVGNNVSFVLFHDMGNVFRYPGDMFTSIKHFHQPDEATCRNVTLPPGVSQANATGTCNFNYYSHAPGLGIRYNTPVGPIRLDLAYNLNPPVYPVFDDYTAAKPYVGQASHFQFFFSIGQAF
jgi:outer membrane protein insertion porin family